VLRDSPRSSLQRFWLVACCALAPLLVVASVAWACTPQATIGVQPAAALSGSAVAVEGADFSSGGPVEIRWNSASGPLLATATGPEFSADIRIPDVPPGVYTVLAVGRDQQGNVVGYARTSFKVEPPPEIALQPDSGRAAAQVLVEGGEFERDDPVEIRWNSSTGPLLASASGPTFSTAVTIPNVSPGPYTVLALGYDDQGKVTGRAARAFQVTASPLPRPPLLDFVGSPLPDLVGPSLSSRALTRGNGTRTVSRKGYVRLFCGRFKEPGVTGRCGATNSRTRVSGARFRRLRAKPFRARPGVPAFVRLRLSKSNRRILRAAKRIRLRGSVVAHDALGNTTSAPFRFTLRAPKAAPRGRR